MCVFYPKYSPPGAPNRSAQTEKLEHDDHLKWSMEHNEVQKEQVKELKRSKEQKRTPLTEPYQRQVSKSASNRQQVAHTFHCHPFVFIL